MIQVNEKYGYIFTSFPSRARSLFIPRHKILPDVMTCQRKDTSAEVSDAQRQHGVFEELLESCFVLDQQDFDMSDTKLSVVQTAQ